MITKQDFCDCELHYFSGADTEKFFDWLKQNGVLNYSALNGWFWDESSDLCPSNPIHVWELFYQGFKETA